MKTDKKPLAFTLAEALLALTIIGVLMALMMRSVNRVSPDKEKILFIKTYHALEHAIANTMNDPSRYDPNYYSDNDVENMTAEEKADLHRDFRDAPMKDAKVNVNGEITSCNANSPSNPCLKKENAMCYFIADSINTVGDVDCVNNTLNMKTSNGVCLRNLVNVDANGSKTFTVDPLCNNEGYAVTIFSDGKMTVPSTNADIGTRQSKAYNWIMDQTQVK